MSYTLICCNVTRIRVELVGIEGNYLSSTRERLVGSYRFRASCNLVPQDHIRVDRHSLQQIYNP